MDQVLEEEHIPLIFFLLQDENPDKVTSDARMLLNIPSFSLIQPDKNIKGAQVTLGNDNKAFRPDFYGLRV